ncbi:MAG TPA: YdaS family helix-turn-helix protein [Hyphomicrobiaceae bacterium]|nr:YdaS family helix-turn-helix protein [Hyphomicrobiaceae bacterium]
MMARKVNNATEAIDVLGGTAAVARLLGVRDNVVSNWRVRGVPPARYLELGDLLKRRRIKFTPDLFGLNPGPD